MQNFNQYLVPRAHGVIKGSATAAQMPDIKGKAVILRALSGNTGSVFVGLSNAVTASHAATNTTTGLELDAGQELELPIQGSLNTLWYICAGADDDISYLVLT